MKKFRNYILAAAGLAVLAITISLTTAGRAAADHLANEFVRISNTAADPVPVKAVDTVPVKGNVHVSGGSVSINSSPTEPVSTKTTMIPTDVFDEDVEVKLKENELEKKKLVVTVPAGKLLKIENVTGEAKVADKEIPSVQVFKNNVSIGYLQGTAPLVPFGTLALSPWVFSQYGPLLTYAKAGDTVEILFATSSNHYGADLQLHFSGYYFDAP